VSSETGAGVPFLAEGVRRHPDGTLAGATVTFRADNVPAVGYRTYWVSPAPGPGGEGWSGVPGNGPAVIENEAFLVEADPARAGALTRILDRRTGTDLLRGPGNELVLQDEYGTHPRWGEGQWLLSPKGPGAVGSPATVRVERCAIGSRLVASFRLGGLRITQETILWAGADRVEFRTHVDGSIGQDRLLRVRFPADVPGGLPVYQCATAVVGRPFGTPDADVARHAFTLDNPAQEWFGVGSTARVVAGEGAWPIGVAEVILPPPPVPDDARVAIRHLVAALAAQGVTATCSEPDGPRYGAIDVDSNLPDCRIALGGPWAAQLLDSLGTALPAAGGRAWVPPARSRAEVFGPSADVRGDRDLPVLIVDGPDLAAAVTALAGDLDDAAIQARAAAPGPDPAWAGHSVALLNRGTPSSLVTPDGTLHIALMRASSSWPAGVWIDGEARVTPDGSSFAWQHWSHTFEYALVAGAGDWRAAGFPLAGQDYNHDLLACETGAHAGPLPASMSLCEVSGPAGPAPMLAALKPRGNPLASGRPGQPDRADGVTVRLRDAGGSPRARVRLFTGLASARLTDLLEGGDGAPVPVTDGAASVDVPTAGTVTVALTVPAQAGPAQAGPAQAGPVQAGSVHAGPAHRGSGHGNPPEPAQPVFTRYWLHGKGPAPAGNLPVAVHLSPGRLALGDASGLRLTVACGPHRASGQVTLDVPDGLVVEPADGLAYDLPGGGYACWDLTVRAGGAPRGRYYLAARIGDDLGQVLEDATLITVGEPPSPPLDLPLADLIPLIEADQQAAAAEVGVRLLPAGLTVGAGRRGEFIVEVTNRTGAPVRGECQLVSPVGTWPVLGPWTQGFAAAAGEAITLCYPVHAAAVRAGSQWWALAKVMYFGRVTYSEPASIEVG
jgi:hypothetical protein